MIILSWTQEALVGAFSVIVKTGCGTNGSFYSTILDVDTINCYEDKCPKQISNINKTHKNWLQVVDGRYPWHRGDVQSLN